MSEIIFPLRPQMRGPAVADLQDALQRCLDRSAVLANDEATRRTMSAAMKPERVEQTYGNATGKLLSVFQKERGLQASGAVDEATANVLNALLREWGVLDGRQSPATQLVTGAVRREDGRAMQGALVRASHVGDLRAIIRLGEDATDAEGFYTVRYELPPGLDGVNLVVKALAKDGKVLKASLVRRQAKPLETIDLVLPMVAAPAEQQRIEGAVVFEHGAPAEGLELRLFKREFGGAAKSLDKTTTLAGGRYAFTFAAGPRSASLEVRAVKKDGNSETEVPLTKPLNELAGQGGARGSQTITLNLVAPATVKSPSDEYTRLTTDLKPHVGEMSKLANAREDAEQQDLTVLNRATGWDARLIALVSVVQRLKADSDVGLPEPALYALLRAGLPSEKLLLAQVAPDVVNSALTKARDAGIVTGIDVDDVKANFTTFAEKVRLAMPVPGSQATYAELLMSSGVPPAVQDKFAAVYLNHRGSGADLWVAARNAGLNDTQVGKLQKQGKLAFLASNSRGLTARLMSQPFQDPAELVAKDFHTPEKWKDELFDAANIPPPRRANLTPAERKALEDLIPTAYVGSAVESRLESYADDMARKLRLSYPTQVLGRLLETDPKFAFGSHANTVKLLKGATAKGFRFGETPASVFFRSTGGLQAGMSDAEFRAAGEQVRTLQRVYQITPHNEAMPVLLALQMNSAFDVMAYPAAQFKLLFNAKYLELYKRPAPSGTAEQIGEKAQQVSSVTYNLFAVARKLDSDPPVAGLSATVQVRENVKAELLKHFPSMESLFGSMDYCECEHCRSVLSPAAYLVDLLQFVDTEPGVWGNFLATWKAQHGGRDYPHQDAANKALKPFDVLQERRPDIVHIALTCENTHTPLPYIDIVNEVLEYHVANGALDAKAVHDTGDAPSADLLAEPQFVIGKAYEELGKARYPLHLPFDLWIETARQFCEQFETPLHRLLEPMRPQDELFATAGRPYGRAEVFTESLGLSPREAAVLIAPNPLADWHELYGYPSLAEATTVKTDPKTGQRVDLHSAKALSRRLGVTYKEIVEIVQTGFINPELAPLRLLYKLGVDVADVRAYRANKVLLPQDPANLTADEQRRRLEAQAFLEQVHEFAAEYQVPSATIEAALDGLALDRVLVLADPDAGCNFDATTLQYAGGTSADGIAFLRINLFVRLWRKLGWSIEETDRALATFLPRTAPFDGTAANLAKQPLLTALFGLAHLKELDEKLRIGKQSRLKLLSLWSDLPTTGKKPLYAQLFLTRSVLKTAPQFDHPLGLYLSAAGVPLQDHRLALQGALGLSADDIDRILTNAGLVLATAELTLPNVSLLYRHALLAKALKLSVRELIALAQLSGLDPFKPVHPDPVKTLAEDQPFSQTLEFVKVAEEVKHSGLDVEDLDYLLRHRFDEAGKYRPDREATLALIKALAEGVRSIRAEHAVPSDAGALSDEVLQQKLGLALPADVAATFMAMLRGTVEYAGTSNVANADRLPPAEFAGEASITVLPHNGAKSQQTLVHRGVMYPAQRAALEAKFLGRLTGAQQGTFQALLTQAATTSQQEGHAFFDKHLLKSGVASEPQSGFLEAADFDLLFMPAPAGHTEAQLQALNRERRARLAKAFFPFLQQRLIRQFVVQTLAAQTGAEPALLEGLLGDAQLVSQSGPLLDAIVRPAQRGLSASFWDGEGATGNVLPSGLFAEADTAAKDAAGNPLKPGGAKSTRFEAYLEPSATGAYRFIVELDKLGAKATLRLPHRSEPVFLSGAALATPDRLGVQPSEFLDLNAGVPYHFSLDIEKFNGGDARLLLQGETLPLGPVSELVLYPANAVDGAERALTLLRKSLQLIQGLGLSEREVRYLLTHPADFGGASLSDLPTKITGDSPADQQAAAKRFGWFRRLTAYARLKQEMAGGTDDLVGVFEAQATVGPDKLEKLVYPRIATITRRNALTIQRVAEALVAGGAPSFANEAAMSRLWEALQTTERFGVPADALRGWTGIVKAGATEQERFGIARDLREAIKARFEPDVWQRVAQPIFDKLRRRQRDALVGFVMRQLGLESMERLYEHFLIDPGMEPVVQTSRIRLAISSVQLFIQRSLLNLEEKVHASTINARQWEWMKRYRLWEANRKIFLFPENWLEPEFRDDKTHLFSELEGMLLQGDVSSDLVEDAFLAYLKKLDELARLDIVAMHIEENLEPALRTLHVFGRTYGQPHKYFYRRYARQMWTPWEPVSAEIEGDHLAPVVWRDRLYLFWVTFMEKAEESLPAARTPSSQVFANPRAELANPLISEAGAAPDDTPLAAITLSEMATRVSANAGKRTIEVQLHWSEYLQGEWTTRESGGFETANSIVVRGVRGFDRRRAFVHVSKEYDPTDGAELGVLVHLGGQINRAFYLAGRNSPAESTNAQVQPSNPFNSANTAAASRYTGSGSLRVSFREKVVTGPSETPAAANADVLQHGGAFSLVPCNSQLLPLALSEDAYAQAADPEAVKAAIESGLAEIASLMKPVFYQDNRHTFFIESDVTERTIEEWQEWIVTTPMPDFGWTRPEWWNELVINAEAPRLAANLGSEDPDGFAIHPGSLIQPARATDWLINPASAVKFGDVLIGPYGQPGIEIQPRTGLSFNRGQVSVNPGSHLAAGATVVVKDSGSFARSGLNSAGGGLNIVGGAGFNSALKKNLAELNEAKFGATAPNSGLVGR